MNYRHKTCFALGLAAFVGTCNAQPTTTPDATPTPLEIVGVRLGMSPDEVRAVLSVRKFPMHEFTSTLSYIDTSTNETVQIPNSMFINAIVQSAPVTGHEQADNLTVFFSPTPGKERVAAIAHYNNYPGNVRELDLVKDITDRYGDMLQDAAPAQNGFQLSRVWSSPTRKAGAGQQCELNLIEHFAKAGWWNVTGTTIHNYVINNQDLLLSLVKKNCGPNIIEINWSDRDPSLPTDKRLLDQSTVSIVSLPLAYESLTAVSKLVRDIEDGNDRNIAPGATEKGNPDL